MMKKLDVEKPIDFVCLKQGQTLCLEAGENKIILVVEGEVYCSISKITILASKMAFYSFREKVSVVAVKDSQIVLFRFSYESHLCKVLSPLDVTTERIDGRTILLPVKSIIMDYLQTVKVYNSRFIVDSYLSDLKLREFGYILKSVYKENQLQDFFRLLPYDDMLFFQMVYSFLPEIRSVGQLAQKMSYSYSGFNKRFRRVFNTSAYNWIKENKAIQVFRDICQTNMSLKQISNSHKFATLSHFNEFCHKNLGNSPSQIRRKNKAKHIVQL
ncbi:AraC family transcriptional regulator [Dysgonomonas sp. 520]|uniref:helix-turn-helix domain-containing protein n=1 Tax=Dysgonomonas sp. 520 TaxID=2302931 RepID=UPI0013D24F97|nr:helix-turn-helix domain-containing protein [Dysgonomonas sp. 520]NDW09533.1 AraC family transcriptional regulator [Dysgonomonas sp. 520]